MNKSQKSLSQFQLALRQMKQNRFAVFCLWLLGLLYFSAIFADILTPYSYENEERDFAYAPASKIHCLTEQGQFSRPFIYGSAAHFDQNHQRIYVENLQEKYPLRFFVKGDEYKILGLFSCSLRLFSVDAPGRIYLWGADSRGRDLYSRVIYGGRISLSIGLIGVLISYSIGLLVGGIAGFYGGRTDEVLMRICEMLMMFPGFYLLLALRAVVPPSFNSVQVYIAIVVILSFIYWAGLARVIRGMCLSLREREFVLAAKAMGLSDLQIIVKHILPHTLSYSIVSIMLSIPSYILAESGLSLVGLGIQDPYASWGNLLSESMGIVQIRFCPWILIPGIFIFLTVMCFNVVGDALRDCLDPHLRGEKRESCC